MHHWGIQYKKKVSLFVCVLFLITLLSASFHSHDHESLQDGNCDHHHAVESQFFQASDVSIEKLSEDDSFVGHSDCLLCVFLSNHYNRIPSAQFLGINFLEKTSVFINTHENSFRNRVCFLQAPKNSPPIDLIG
ncbi:MAG TPA: hypothetical protein PKC21_07920 [Oligoflexia bacterium]|nr:hypothetical protein [Oligoflexia bacterium]HMR25264.1 hypothetical protein [Oligoflexia bacterium]